MKIDSLPLLSMDCNVVALRWHDITDPKLFINAIYRYKQKYLNIVFIMQVFYVTIFLGNPWYRLQTSHRKNPTFPRNSS